MAQLSPTDKSILLQAIMKSVINNYPSKDKWNQADEGELIKRVGSCLEVFKHHYKALINKASAQPKPQPPKEPPPKEPEKPKAKEPVGSKLTKEKFREWTDFVDNVVVKSKVPKDWEALRKFIDKEITPKLDFPDQLNVLEYFESVQANYIESEKLGENLKTKGR